MRLSLSHVLSLALVTLAPLGCVDRGEVLRPRDDEAISNGGAAGEGALPPPPPPVVVSELTIGMSHVAAIAAERLYLWGANESGQLGQNDTVERHVPTELVTDLRFVSIASGDAHLCGIDDVGSVYCWGANERGQLGQGDRERRLIPTHVTLPVPARSVTASFSHACALLNDASLHCWGRNEEGELGQDDGPPPMGSTIADALLPVAVPGSDWSLADAGNGFTCGIRLDGTLWCWGRNSDFQLGTQPEGQIRRPVQVGPDTDWLRVDAGQQYAFALKQDHSLWCWGLNTARATDEGFPLGIDTDRIEAPTRLGTATDWVAFATRVFHTCAVNRAGELWCWGRAIEGQLGTGDLELRTSPIAVATDIADVAVSWFNTCALTKTGRILCTGKNDHGEIGNDSTERPLRFTDVTPIAR